MIDKEIDPKLKDLEDGMAVEMTPEEADELGAFKEDALSEEEARESIAYREVD